jgi:hypothetical protein
MSTTQIAFSHTVNGTPTSATSVVLSDPTGAFGVKRNDTGGVVVADGTAMTQQSTGVYTYSFTDPAPNLTYTYWLEWVYQGVTYRQERVIASGSAGTGSTLTLSDLRNLVRLYARNAQDSIMYTDAQIDVAIASAADDFIRWTQYTKTISSFATAAGTNTFSLAVNGFEPSRMIDVYLSGSNVEVNWQAPSYPMSMYTEGSPSFGNTTQTTYLRVTDYSQAATEAIGQNQTGQPILIAFGTNTTGILYPTPDNTYTVNVRWSEPFTGWTAGTQGAYSSGVTYQRGDIVSSSGTLYKSIQPNNAGNAPASSPTYWTSTGSGTAAEATSITFNLPDNVLREVCRTGAPSRLQGTEPENAYARVAAEEWGKFVATMMARSGFGVRSVVSNRRIR